MIDRLKRALTAAAVLAVAAVFAALALFAIVYALWREVLEVPWAFAATAGIFAAVAGATALVLRGSAQKHAQHAEHEHHGLAGLAGGLPHQLSAQLDHLKTWAKGKPVAAYAAGALATIILVRRPGLLLFAGSQLLGLATRTKRRSRSPVRGRGAWKRR